MIYFLAYEIVLVDFELLPKIVYLCGEIRIVKIGILDDCLIPLVGMIGSLVLV